MKRELIIQEICEKASGHVTVTARSNQHDLLVLYITTEAARKLYIGKVIHVSMEL